jgi:hypothetical protein
MGEAVCHRSDFRQLPWIRRQRKLNRTRPGGLEGTALHVAYLTETAPVKRVLTEEQRANLVERMMRARTFLKQAI